MRATGSMCERFRSLLGDFPVQPRDQAFERPFLIYWLLILVHLCLNMLPGPTYPIISVFSSICIFTSFPSDR